MRFHNQWKKKAHVNNDIISVWHTQIDQEELNSLLKSSWNSSIRRTQSCQSPQLHVSLPFLWFKKLFYSLLILLGNKWSLFGLIHKFNSDNMRFEFKYLHLMLQADLSWFRSILPNANRHSKKSNRHSPRRTVLVGDDCLLRPSRKVADIFCRQSYFPLMSNVDRIKT